MDTKYKKFIEKVDERIKNKTRIESFLKEKEIDGIVLHGLLNHTPTINFYLSYSESYGVNSFTSTLFMLDEEDLEYLTKKYSGKLKEEYEKNLAELNSKYSV